MKTFGPLTLALMIPATAQAALQCNYYDDFVAAAVMVMQIDDVTVSPPATPGADCTVSGTIVRSFLGPHPVGTRVQTPVPCIGVPAALGGDGEIEVGPAIYKDYAALVAAPVIELHIAPESGPAGHGAGVVLLEAPTDSPQYTSMCG
jgi:hypothetical protein